MRLKLTLFNDDAEMIDSVFIEMPDVDWLYLGKVVDEIVRWPRDRTGTKVHLWDGNIVFQVTIPFSTCSATVVAAYIVDELRTTEGGVFTISWGLPHNR